MKATSLYEAIVSVFMGFVAIIVLVVFALFFVLGFLSFGDHLSQMSQPSGIAGSITNVAAAQPSGVAVSGLVVRWQFDPVREENRLADKEEKAYVEFMATNKPNSNGIYWIGFMRQHFGHEDIHASSNTIELGYRSDGVVVWRVPPEATNR